MNLEDESLFDEAVETIQAYCYGLNPPAETPPIFEIGYTRGCADPNCSQCTDRGRVCTTCASGYENTSEGCTATPSSYVTIDDMVTAYSLSTATFASELTLVLEENTLNPIFTASYFTANSLRTPGYDVITSCELKM